MWRNRRGGSECRGLEPRTSWDKWMINDFYDEIVEGRRELLDQAGRTGSVREKEASLDIQCFNFDERRPQKKRRNRLALLQKVEKATGIIGSVGTFVRPDACPTDGDRDENSFLGVTLRSFLHFERSKKGRRENHSFFLIGST
ncbi:hypothetical protein C4D60_Mb11t08140 [Musa balbisiana]|uniref:Uncharacterized protein n=1 Tax=Musa balbisiana TaxID=52838 RepID=A0A4V4H5D5_MUSBA|nr:hypothetical protein C4D60_Mb11t08140 [Musa balbisiana]